MSDTDPERLADELEREADKLEQHRDELQSDIEAVRQDWERKRQDGGVPGAVPPQEDAPADAARTDED